MSDDFDFTSTGGNYFQHGRGGPSPLDLPPLARFKLGERVRKIKGSSWQGRIVGWYSTTLTPVGYAVESEREPGSVQIYPAAALERVP